MRKYFFISALTIILVGCSSNEESITKSVEEVVINSSQSDKEFERIEDVEYINNIASHMKQFLKEGQYVSAILAYKTNIQMGINRTANENIINIYNEAVKGYISLKDKGEHPNLEFDRSILDSNLIPIIDEIEEERKAATKELQEEKEEQLANKTTIDVVTYEPSIDPNMLYDYAQEQFNILTNYGDNYIPEIHDPIVMEKTAHAFNIPLRQVEKLYYKGAGF